MHISIFVARLNSCLSILQKQKKRYALVLTLNDRAADRADHRFVAQRMEDEFSNEEDDEDDDASIVRWP